MDWRNERQEARKTNDLEFFLKHPNPLVRSGLLDNPKLTNEIIFALSHDDDINIREAVARKYKNLVANFVSDSSWRVRYAAINDPNIPIEVLSLYKNDPDERIKSKIDYMLEILQNYTPRLDFDNAITIKLIIPGTCNANCRFCYGKGYVDSLSESEMKILEDAFLVNFTESLEKVIQKISGKQPISVDITGNEPTFNYEFLSKVLSKLRAFRHDVKINRTTMTTNGFHLLEVTPMLKGAVDYVNVSVHHYDFKRRNEIFGATSLTDNKYKEVILKLLDEGIHTSAVCVIDGEINDFSSFRDRFIEWAEDIGFVSLRFRRDVFWESPAFITYKTESETDKRFSTIKMENTPDSNWCQLSTQNGFQVFFLKGVPDTSIVSPGIEFIIHSDGLAYADYNKIIPFDDYRFPVGYVFDEKVKCKKGVNI